MDPVLDAWCVHEAAALSTPEALLTGYAAQVRARGVPVVRLNVPLRALHPQIRVSSYSWTLDAGAQAAEQRRHADAEWQARVARSPFRLVYTEGQRLVRRRLDDPACPDDFGILAELRAVGMTDYLVLADHLGPDALQAVTFATDAPAGFTDAHVDVLRASLPALLLRLELLRSREIARVVCTTYLGSRTGPRVLAGHIHRGEVTELDAVVGFCDLRGFTARSAARSPVEVTAFLNDWFERVEEEAVRHGAEILKLIGDAALLAWPAPEEDGAAVVEACGAALDMARRLGERLTAETDLRCGMALHRGRVAYGNIGGHERLDFTVIGDTVNVASRLEGLCGTLGLPWVVSEAVARHVGTPLRCLGAHALKGVVEPVTVYGPPA
jgi:adenylate cyclase